MISRTKTGRSFGGLARYLVQGHKDRNEDKKSEILAAEGVRTDTVEHMIADFNRGRKVNPGLGQAVWHTSLSFNPDDTHKLDSEKMREIAEDYMQEMGLMGTQYAIIRHRDTPGHEHLHIVANRVADDGHTISDKKNFYRSTEALVKLIQKYELTPPQGLRPEKQKPEQLHGVELTKYQIRQVLATTLTTATQLEDLRPALAAEQITYKTFLNAAGEPVGISFEKDGLTFKGSEIGRPYSFAGIVRQTAANRLAQEGDVLAPSVSVVPIDQAPLLVSKPALPMDAPLVPEMASRPVPQAVPAEVPPVATVVREQAPTEQIERTPTPAFQLAEVPQEMLAHFGWSVARLIENGQLQQLLAGVVTDLLAVQVEVPGEAPIAFEGRFALERKENGAVELKMALPKMEAPQLVPVVQQLKPAAPEQRPVAKQPPVPELKPKPALPRKKPRPRL